MLMKPVMLRLAAAIFCTVSASASASADERLRFSVPAAPWDITLSKGKLSVEGQQIKPDGRSGYFSLADKSNGFTVSFFIEPVTKCKDARSCRDLIRNAGNPGWENPRDVVESEMGEASVFEFFMPSFRGAPVRQQHLYAQFVRDGYWVDMHVSKVLYAPKEHKLFEELIGSVKFEPKAAAARTK